MVQFATATPAELGDPKQPDETTSPQVQQNIPPSPNSNLFVNLVNRIPSDKLQELGQTVVDGFNVDEQSRSEWLKMYSEWMRLWYVRPTHDQKNDPWDNASNMVLPMLNIACTQFWARAMDAQFGSKDIVKAVPTGQQEQIDIASSERVAMHMNFQLSTKMPNFFEGFSKSMMQLPVAGTVIRKTYYDDILKTNVSDFVSADKFSVNYFTRYLDQSYRYTHILDENLDLLRRKEASGVYCNVNMITIGSITDDTAKNSITDTQQSTDKNAGVDQPTEDRFGFRDILEQHTYLALFDEDGGFSGQDGVMKPYIIWVDKETQVVLRIVERETKIAGEKIIFNYFTKYELLPSPDNSFYSVGFGHLLMRINETANTLVNELTDAGSLANTQSGFVNGASPLVRGDVTMRRGEFIDVDLNTDDIRKSMMPLTFKEPSHVLFSLLGLLQDYTNRVTTVSEMFTGELPRSDTSATAVVSLLEQGLKVFSAIYRGLHGSFSKELDKLYILNRIWVKPEEYFAVVVNQDAVDALGVSPKVEGRKIRNEDYSKPLRIMPVSDPSIVSKTEKVAKAQTEYTLVLQNPLLANNPMSLFAATENLFKQLENNTAVTESILGPVRQQIELQRQAQEQQAQMQQLKQEAINRMAAEMAAGNVPEELIMQTVAEQQLGQQVAAAQAEEEINQGQRAR